MIQVIYLLNLPDVDKNLYYRVVQFNSAQLVALFSGFAEHFTPDTMLPAKCFPNAATRGPGCGGVTRGTL